MTGAVLIDFAGSLVATSLRVGANPFGLVVFFLPLLLLSGIRALIGLCGGVVLGTALQLTWGLSSQRARRTRLALSGAVVAVGNTLFWTLASFPYDDISLRWLGGLTCTGVLIAVLHHRRGRLAGT